MLKDLSNNKNWLSKKIRSIQGIDILIMEYLEWEHIIFRIQHDFYVQNKQVIIFREDMIVFVDAILIHKNTVPLVLERTA